MEDITYIEAKTILSKLSRPADWFGHDYNMNIYRGCSHGCIYCDSRSRCYGINLFNEVKVKKDALLLLRNELRRKIQTGVVATGSMSDPYNPLEEKLLLTRHALSLLSAFDFGVSIATKSTLITRDIDILTEIKETAPAIVKVTITTWDKDLCSVIEPDAASSQERFEAIAKLSDQGIFSGVLLMPLLPYLNDSEENIQSVVKGAYDSGAKFVYPAFGMTMRDNQRDYYYNMLDRHFPGLKEKYILRYKNNYYCSIPHAKEKWHIFVSECEKYGLLYHMRDIIRAYKLGYGDTQLNLFY